MITQALAKTAKVPRKPITFVSPNGWEYKWTQEADPTEEDWARLMEVDAKRGVNPARGATTGAAVGAIGKRPEQKIDPKTGNVQLTPQQIRTAQARARANKEPGYRFEGPLGAAEAANQATERLGKILSPLNVGIVPGSPQSMLPIKPSEVAAGLVMAPINVGADIEVAFHPDATLEQRVRATANVMLNVLPVEAVAGNILKSAGKPVVKKIADAFRNKNAVALEKALVEAEQQGFNVTELIKTKPVVASQAPKAPKVAEMPGSIAGATTRVKPKAPLKALPERTARPVEPGGLEPAANPAAVRQKELSASRRKTGIPEPEPPAPVPVETPKRTFTGEVPKVAKSVEAPKVETPNVPKADAPKVDAPKIEEPEIKADAPKFEIPGGQAAKNEATAALRKSKGLRSLSETKPETTQQWFDEANRRGIPARAASIARKANEGLRTTRFDDVETAGMSTRLDELEVEFNKTTDPEKLSGIIDEVDEITKALKRSGKEWGREGVARQTWFKQDYSPGGLARRFSAEGAEKIDAATTQKAKTLGDDITNLTKEVEAAKAQEGLFRTRGARLKGDAQNARAAAIKRMKDRYNAPQARRPGGKQSGAVDLSTLADLKEYAQDIMVIVRSLVAEGAVKLGDVVPGVQKILRENELDLSEENIQRIIAGEYSRAQRELSDAARTLQDIRKEAKASTGAQRAKLEKRIKELERRIQTQEGPVAKEKIPISKELEDLEIKLMSRKVEADSIAAELRRQRLAKDKSGFQKTMQEVADISRSFVASSDLSAPFNQGVFTLLGHPIANARAAKEMLDVVRIWHGEKGEQRLGEYIARMRVNKNYDRAVASGLEVHSTRLGRGEEFFTSQLVNDLPIISHSERAYTAYLNRLRMDMFDNLVSFQEKPFMGIGKGKKLSIEELRQTSEYINTVTGVGTGSAATALKNLNRVIPAAFAPGYMVSRWKTVLGTPLINAAIRKNPKLAVAILKDYAAFSVMAGGTLLAAKNAGFEVAINPRDPEFGRIKAGNVELDPFGGIASVMRLMNKVNKNRKSWPSTGGFYAAGKASPVARTVASAFVGESFGKKTDPTTAEGIGNLVMGLLPISVQTQTELWKDSEGLTDEQKAALTIIGILGGNMNIKDEPGKGR